MSIVLPKTVRTYGGIAVPYTASWEAEEGSFSLEVCPYANKRAICQPVAIGEGRPRFGKPHCQRQREVIACGLCDLCAKSLAQRTKVSLSHARMVSHGAEGPAVLQVEPLLHKECAAISMTQCPSLKRDLKNGTLFVRQVTRYRVQFALMSPEYGKEMTGIYEKAVGHAKVELQKWRDRDAAWLERAAA